MMYVTLHVYCPQRSSRMPPLNPSHAKQSPIKPHVLELWGDSVETGYVLAAVIFICVEQVHLEK